MNALLYSQLEQYLSVIFKNFSKENFSSAILKGEFELRDLALNEELLEPFVDCGGFSVRSAICSRVRLSVPWLNLSRNPIIVWIEKVETTIAELQDRDRKADLSPDVARFLETFVKLQKKDKAGKPQRSWGFIEKVMEGVRIEIGTILLTCHTRAFTSLHCEIKNVSVYSTNKHREVVSLEQTWKESKRKPLIILHKELSVESLSVTISVATFDTSGGYSTSHVRLLRSVPVKVHHRVRRSKDLRVVSGEIDVVIPDLRLLLTTDHLHLLQSFFATLPSFAPKAASGASTGAGGGNSLLAGSSAPATPSSAAASASQASPFCNGLPEFTIAVTALLEHVVVELRDVQQGERGFSLSAHHVGLSYFHTPFASPGVAPAASPRMSHGEEPSPPPSKDPTAQFAARAKRRRRLLQEVPFPRGINENEVMVSLESVQLFERSFGNEGGAASHTSPVFSLDHLDHTVPAASDPDRRSSVTESDAVLKSRQAPVLFRVASRWPELPSPQWAYDCELLISSVQVLVEPVAMSQRIVPMLLDALGLTLDGLEDALCTKLRSFWWNHKRVPPFCAHIRISDARVVVPVPLEYAVVIASDASLQGIPEATGAAAEAYDNIIEGHVQLLELLCVPVSVLQGHARSTAQFEYVKKFERSFGVAPAEQLDLNQGPIVNLIYTHTQHIKISSSEIALRTRFGRNGKPSDVVMVSGFFHHGDVHGSDLSLLSQLSNDILIGGQELLFHVKQIRCQIRTHQYVFIRLLLEELFNKSENAEPEQPQQVAAEAQVARRSSGPWLGYRFGLLLHDAMIVGIVPDYKWSLLVGIQVDEVIVELVSDQDSTQGPVLCCNLHDIAVTFLYAGRQQIANAALRTLEVRCPPFDSDNAAAGRLVHSKSSLSLPTAMSPHSTPLLAAHYFESFEVEQAGDVQVEAAVVQGSDSEGDEDEDEDVSESELPRKANLPASRSGRHLLSGLPSSARVKSLRNLRLTCYEPKVSLDFPRLVHAQRTFLLGFNSMFPSVKDRAMRRINAILTKPPPKPSPLVPGLQLQRKPILLSWKINVIRGTCELPDMRHRPVAALALEIANFTINATAEPCLVIQNITVHAADLVLYSPPFPNNSVTPSDTGPASHHLSPSMNCKLRVRHEWRDAAWVSRVHMDPIPVDFTATSQHMFFLAAICEAQLQSLHTAVAVAKYTPEGLLAEQLEGVWRQLNNTLATLEHAISLEAQPQSDGTSDVDDVLSRRLDRRDSFATTQLSTMADYTSPSAATGLVSESHSAQSKGRSVLHSALSRRSRSVPSVTSMTLTPALHALWRDLPASKKGQLMVKLQGKLGLQVWKRRFFVLKQHYLFYDKASRKEGESSRFVDLHGCSVEPLVDEDKAGRGMFTFVITTWRGERRWYRANDSLDRVHWIDAIVRAGAVCNERHEKGQFCDPMSLMSKAAAASVMTAREARVGTVALESLGARTAGGSSRSKVSARQQSMHNLRRSLRETQHQLLTATAQHHILLREFAAMRAHLERSSAMHRDSIDNVRREMAAAYERAAQGNDGAWVVKAELGRVRSEHEKALEELESTRRALHDAKDSALRAQMDNQQLRARLASFTAPPLQPQAQELSSPHHPPSSRHIPGPSYVHSPSVPHLISGPPADPNQHSMASTTVAAARVASLAGSGRAPRAAASRSPFGSDAAAGVGATRVRGGVGSGAGMETTASPLERPQSDVAPAAWPRVVESRAAASTPRAGAGGSAPNDWSDEVSSVPSSASALRPVHRLRPTDLHQSTDRGKSMPATSL